ncbi:Uncharacterised protein [Sphingobacterium daejeonense]|nr:Uncharacterised protein [Sphingobacterium daejeonense]
MNGNKLNDLSIDKLYKAKKKNKRLLNLHLFLFGFFSMISLYVYLVDEFKNLFIISFDFSYYIIDILENH